LPHARHDGEGARAELMPALPQRAFCEWLGTAFLLAAVVGSGIMAQKLAGGNDALALLCNTLPTGAILAVLILVFGPLSGAHFNHQPEAQHPNSSSTSWQADYPIFDPLCGLKSDISRGPRSADIVAKVQNCPVIIFPP
jgi:hypothetical protein